MSGGGNKQKTTVKPPKELRGAFGDLGFSVQDLIGDINNRGSYQGKNNTFRNLDLSNITARNGSFGIDQGLLQTTFDTGGFTPFTNDDQAAFSAARGLSGSDPALGNAIGRFKNNAGIDQLANLGINGKRDAALSRLEGYDPSTLKGFRPQALRDLDFNTLEATARGDYLDVGSNPYLQDALSNAQRRTTEAFNRDVRPGLNSQFGGGFGLSGSSSINAQRRATEDLSRALSEQSTSTLANQYNLERGFQEQASSRLGELGLGRAQGIDQLKFDRANQIDGLNFNRASELGQLGLGFTNAGIDAGSSLADAQLRQAQGIANTGNTRRQQELQRIGLLNNIGQQHRQQARDLYNTRQQSFDARNDDRIRQLQGVSSIINGTPFNTQQTGSGGSQVGSIFGGALAGGGLGTAIGGPIGGGIGLIGGGLLGAF